MIDKMEEDRVYPSIVFEVADNLFSVDSRYVESIMQLPKCDKVPDARPEVKGMFHFLDKTVTMYDLRLVMRLRTREEDFSTFCEMIDARKNDHKNWVNALERSAKTGEQFTLATDFHKCALGKWCDSFQCDVAEVNYHINRISEPHRLLHETAIKVHDILADPSISDRHEAAMEVVGSLRKTHMANVLGLLEETKQVFKDAYFREMGLVLNGEHAMGLVVDNILAVEELTPVSDGFELNKFLPEPYITQVLRSKKIKGLILGLDIEMLMATIGVML